MNVDTFLCENLGVEDDSGAKWGVFRVSSGGKHELLEAFRSYPDAVHLLRKLRGELSTRCAPHSAAASSTLAERLVAEL